MCRSLLDVTSVLPQPNYGRIRTYIDYTKNPGFCYNFKHEFFIYFSQLFRNNSG